jgi:hypothetical protein
MKDPEESQVKRTREMRVEQERQIFFRWELVMWTGLKWEKSENVNINRNKFIQILQISYIPVVVFLLASRMTSMPNTHQRFPEYPIQTNRGEGDGEDKL